jgi:hypothetical protein
MIIKLIFIGGMRIIFYYFNNNTNTNSVEVKISFISNHYEFLLIFSIFSICCLSFTQPPKLFSFPQMQRWESFQRLASKQQLIQWGSNDDRLSIAQNTAWRSFQNSSKTILF